MQAQALLQRLSNNPSQQEQDELMKGLANALNDLLSQDFPALVQLLYRLDVPEHRLKTLLKEKPSADAGEVLAHLIVERQAAKAAARAAFKASPPIQKATDEERW